MNKHCVLKATNLFKTKKLKITTPLADAIMSLRKLNLNSFHALPIYNSRSLLNSAYLKKYHNIFSKSFLNTDMTFTGELFDSFFFPKTVIKEAQALAAQAFGAKETLFITTGTTTSIQIALDALLEPNDRVLADKSCHQAVHFALAKQQCDVKYITPIYICQESQRQILNKKQLLEELRTAQKAGNPYKLIIINAASYEGVMYNLEDLLTECLAINKQVKFLLDEAWSAAAYFHPYYQNNLAMLAAATLQKQYPGITVISTQSAHKSLSTLRQASYLHIYGCPETVDQLNSSRYKIHTTSPSYPILASLDLARAQMTAEGNTLVNRALNIAKVIREKISSERSLSCYSVNDIDSLPKYLHNEVIFDPTKISLNVKKLAVDAATVKKILIENFGVYINRYSENSLLINIHIGVTWKAVNKLLAGLKIIQKRYTAKTHVKTSLNRFIVPYPPGVPLIVPGEEVNAEVREKIYKLQDTGVEIANIYIK